MVGATTDAGRPTGLSDIFAGQASRPDELAELYDLEHEAHEDDLAFYREFARRSRGAVLDLGCGSGRLWPALLEGGARRVVGIDGSAELLQRAARRVASDLLLRAAHDSGRLEFDLGDVRRFERSERYRLVLAAGVVPHLAGSEDLVSMLVAARRHLTGKGRLLIDLPGPGGLPARDLPPAVDWERRLHGRRVIRRSRLLRRRTSDGLVVVLSTVTDVERDDGTFAHLPASFRLWYPSRAQLEALVRRARLEVSAVYGSHDLDRYSRTSERLIVVAERAERNRSG